MDGIKHNLIGNDHQAFNFFDFRANLMVFEIMPLLIIVQTAH